MTLALAVGGGIILGGLGVFAWFVWIFKDVYR